MTFPSFTPSFTALTRTAGQLQSLALTVLPHGGQRSARRNAWAAMSQDHVAARSRREVDLAVSVAHARTNAERLASS